MISQTVEPFAADMAQVGAEVARNIPKMLIELNPVVLAGIEANFNSAQSPDGVGWPPRKDPGDGHPLLIDTTALKMAATLEGAQGHVGRVEGDALLVGVDKSGGTGGVPGAGVHNYGFGNIPQREFLGLSEERLVLCDGVLADACIKLVVGQ